MSTRSLPSRPSLDQLKRQAKELKHDHGDGKRPAAARVIAHHPRWKRQSLEASLATSLTLADAQLVVAREYGFDSWARLKHHVETAHRVANYTPHPRMAEALDAVDLGNVTQLANLLSEHPDLIGARTHLDPPYHYFTGATLLHHVAMNPARHVTVPPNIVDVARILLEAGADADETTLGPNGGTTMGLLITSKQASDANVSGPLIDLLLSYGAKLQLGSDMPDTDGPSHDVLDLPLANHAPRAAEKLIALGAKAEVYHAAALGRMDLLENCFERSGRLREPPRRNGTLMSERDAIGLALLFAYVNQRREAVNYLLAKDGNWDMIGVNNGTVLHRAAWDGDLSMVKELVRRGADVTNRDNPFVATPLSWARHNKQQDVFDWMCAHCAIDLHDAVCFGLLDHVEARLREDPTSVNRRIDQWEIPGSTPLHWAAWVYQDDVGATSSRGSAERSKLVRLLLANGADPNVIAGNGLTALDIALASGAAEIATLLEEHGGKNAAAV